jgi:hypothetical protein
VWTKVAEDLNDRYPILPIEDVIKELILHKTIVIFFAFRFTNNFLFMWEISLSALSSR